MDYTTTTTLPRISKEDSLKNAFDAFASFLERIEEEETTTISSLQKEAWQISEDHGFHNASQSFGDKLMLIVSEASEALEAFREGADPEETYYSGTRISTGIYLEEVPASEKGTLETPKPCGIPSEIADILIRCFDFAECYGFDLESIVVEKMAFNRTRPFMHGKTL